MCVGRFTEVFVVKAVEGVGGTKAAYTLYMRTLFFKSQSFFSKYLSYFFQQYKNLIAKFFFFEGQDILIFSL